MIKLRGVIQLTGPHGAGKTEFALQYGDLIKTCLLDNDIKGRATFEAIDQLLAEQEQHFGKYVDVVDYLKDTLIGHDRYQRLVNLVASLSEHETIIVDTWSDWGGACREYAKHHPEDFRKPIKNRAGQDIYRSSNSQIMQGEVSADGRILEANLINQLRGKCDLLFLITHLKPFYRNQVDTGKEVPIQSKILDRVCDARIWIRENSQSAVPIGLIIKRPSIRKIVDGRMETVNFLPQKLTPQADDKSLWDVINRYHDNPMGNRIPTVDETPNETEMAILKNTLTVEQKRMYEYALRAVNGTEQQKFSSKETREKVDVVVREKETSRLLADAILRKKEKGLSTSAIYDLLVEKNPEVTIPMIIETS